MPCTLAVRGTGLSRTIVCAAVHTDCDRLSAYIRPPVMAGRLAEADTGSRGADQHF